MHNYSTGMGVVSALQAVSVRRLTRTWKGLGRKEEASWNSMIQIFNADHNFSAYRRQLQSAHGEPCLPYIGVLLQDLLMVEELPTFLPNKMVNFKKMRRFVGMLKEEIQVRQGAADRYAIEPILSIKDFLLKAPAAQDAELYRLSRQCEPAPLA